MQYRHKIIQELANLIEQYGDKSNDIVMKSIWWGIKGQVPSILQGLDGNEEAIAEIEAKLKEVLGIPPEPAPAEKAILADQPEMQEIKEEPVGKTNTPEEKEDKAKGTKKKKGKRKATKE